MLAAWLSVQPANVHGGEIRRAVDVGERAIRVVCVQSAGFGRSSPTKVNDVSCVNLGGSSWRAGPSCSSASAASSRNSGLCSPSQQRQRGSRDRARTVHVRPCPSRQQLAERNVPRVRALRTDVVGRCDQSDATRLEHPAQVSWPAPAVQHDQTLNVPPTSFSYSG